MFGKVFNLPFKVLGGVARAVQAQDAKKWTDRETQDAEAATNTAPISIAVPDDFEAGPLRIDASAAIPLLEQGCIVDVSPGATHSPIPGALYIPRDEIGIRVAELPPDTRTVVVSRDVSDSDTVVRFLRHRGIDETWSLEGGLDAWVQAGGSMNRKQK